MTYCVGLKIEAGLVLLSDTRTNAGIDNIARYRKMFVFEEPGERVVAIMAAGNLGITQGVVTRVETAVKHGRVDPEIESVLNCESLYRAAQIVGEDDAAGADARPRQYRGAGVGGRCNPDHQLVSAAAASCASSRSISAGNFVEASEDTPFLQIGEHKYGKPILDRVIKPDTTMEEAIKAALVSMDSTLRSNLSVGMPLDMAVIDVDTYHARTQRIEYDHPQFREISDSWASALREAFNGLPTVKI